MKTISVLLALAALVIGEAALAAAVATSVTGATVVQTGTAPQRPLRTGDRVNQGDTIITGASSSAVLKFDDGQVAALTSNTRMTVTTFAYRPQEKKGNVLLSLVNGGMRYISGLIGKNSPDNVAIRAATATIGIRGTAISCATESGVVICLVDEGSISFTFNGQTVIIDAGKGALTQPNGSISQGTINDIQTQLRGTAAGQQILQTLGGLTGLSDAINRAFPGVPPQGQGDPPDTSPGIGSGPGRGTPTGPGVGGGGGGGRPGSPS